MSLPGSRCVFALLLATLGLGPLMVSTAPAEVPTADGQGPFPEKIEAKVADQNVSLRLTGWAYRKAFGITFYKIGGYCDVACSPVPRNVDELAGADVPKQLILVMERDIADHILRGSFEKAFAANDPDGKFPQQIDTLLDHMTATSLKKGDRVTLTHLPKRGVQCMIRDEQPTVVADPQFAYVVWNVYMGPKAVTADLRKGLGSKLAVE